MRKTTAIPLALLAMSMTAAGGHAAMMQMKATLAASSEVPPNQSKGTGSAAVNLDTATKQMSWTIQYSGLSGPATAAHFHCPADPGANAGVAVPITVGPSPIQGNATLTDAQMADLQNGKCYINVHTEQNKGGELRGQVMK
jgi:hypothetical protein